MEKTKVGLDLSSSPNSLSIGGAILFMREFGGIEACRPLTGSRAYKMANKNERKMARDPDRRSVEPPHLLGDFFADKWLNMERP